MKLIIALALFAVAFADEVRVVSLPRAPAPVYGIADMRPLFVPQEVIDAIKLEEHPLVMRDAPIDDDLRVRFVDSPLEETPQVIEEDLRVKVVDAPLEVDAVPVEEYDYGLEPHYIELPLETVPVAEEIIPEPIRIAEPSLPAVEEVYDSEAVMIEVPAIVNAVEESYVPGVVNFVDSPLVEVEAAEEIFVPEPVMLAEAPLPAFESADEAAPAVEPIKIAVPSFPGKQFDDPRLR